MPNYSTAQVTAMFERPSNLNLRKDYGPIPVDRIDVKRGYCFVFLQDAKSQEDKTRIEEFVNEINGM
jgi:arginine/serine-rich splicing factor 4/5/6